MEGRVASAHGGYIVALSDSVLRGPRVGLSDRCNNRLTEQSGSFLGGITHFNVFSDRGTHRSIEALVCCDFEANDIRVSILENKDNIWYLMMDH